MEKKKESRSLRWKVSIEECMDGSSVEGDVLGRGIYLVPKPRTIFSVGVRT